MTTAATTGTPTPGEGRSFEHLLDSAASTQYRTHVRVPHRRSRTEVEGNAMQLVEVTHSRQPVVAQQQLRLTARGRRVVRVAAWSVVTTVVATVVLLAWLIIAAALAPGASAGDGSPAVVDALQSGPSGGVTEVVVRPGDTLWGIAREHAPGQDPRSVVAAVVELNDLPDAQVQAGASVLVPRG